MNGPESAAACQTASACLGGPDRNPHSQIETAMSSSNKPRQGRSSRSPEPDLDQLAPDEAGALRIGATDHGMVRLILTTHQGVVELDFPPEDASEIAEEILAAAARCDGGAKAPPQKKR